MKAYSLSLEVVQFIVENTCVVMLCIGGGKGGARGLKPPLGLLRGGLAPPQNDITRNYLSWSGAENRDKDQDTLIEQSL